MVISFVAPAIRAEWGLSLTDVGLLATAHYLGMFLGASGIGYLADHVGRKVTVQSAIVTYSLFTGLCAFAWDQNMMMLLRFLGGLGTGGFMPVLSTWMSEYIPARRRGTFVAVLESSWSFGALLISIIAFLVIPAHGWRAVFPVMFLSLILVAIVQRYIPESIRYLEVRGRIEEAKRILEKHTFPVPAETIPPEVCKASVKELLSEALRRRTVMLWILWFCIAYTYHGIFIWLPTVLSEQGFTLVRALWFALLITSLQIPGYLSAAYLIDKVGRKPILVGYMVLAGVASYFFGTSRAELPIIAFGGAISFFNLGAWAVTYAYTPELYPTRIRATGAGWSGAVGRIAGIIAPIATAIFVSSMGVFQTFLGFFAAHFVAAVAVAVLGVETVGKTLEEISR
ncbi:MFS transporter [Candidatus Bathyarchaeota archaeon]|nr:MFS transporter [Candidatus Bathyarchaeota archaeon]